MRYDIFKFGALHLDTKIQAIPKQPTDDGDIPACDGKSAIAIGPAGKGERITWVKPNGLNLLIADRVLLAKVSWKDLAMNGFVKGKTILIDGQWFHCRLLQVGENGHTSNEWDKILDVTGEDNSLWHWEHMYFWGFESTCGTSTRAVRGYHSTRFWHDYAATTRYTTVGFRPILEPLPADNSVPNINLDGIDFRLTSLPEQDAFCPILQPIQGDVFKDIPVGGKVKMYTFLEDEHPVHFGASIKDASKLTLTDRYFGDEYLVSWTISNGVAVASQALLQKTQKGEARFGL